MTTQETTKRDIQATMGNADLTLAFSHGKTLTISLDNLSADIVDRATLHGLKQKLVDAAAISRNPDTGATASIEDKYQAVLEVYNRLLAGEWNKQRGEGSGASPTGLLFRALCRLYPSKSPEQIREYLDGKDKSQQAALRGNPKIAKIIDEIRAESANAVNSDDLLSELEG